VPTFDVHQHLLPAPVVAALRARSEPPRVVGRSLELREGSFPFEERDNDLAERIAVLDRDGTDVAVVSLAPTLEVEEHPELRKAYHEGIRDLVAHAGGRLRAFASGVCLEGFAGACVSAQALVGGLGDLSAELARAGQVLFVHPGPPGSPPASAPPWWTAVVDYTAQMQAAFISWLAGDGARDPELDVIFAVLAGGAPIQLERLASRGVDTRGALHPNVFLDTASYGERALELTLATYGVGQLVYGSDMPVIESEPTLRSIRGFGQAVADVVCRDNPARLLQ
jgi:6-methylsalicylate decarboxylase